VRRTAVIVLFLLLAIPNVASASSATRAISVIFGPYASQALRVARCESGLRTNAWNGQYHGLFQMGVNERATYGDGYDAWSQTRAAYRYFVSSGRDWSPWSCKP